MGIAARFEFYIYIYSKSLVGRISFPQVFIMATVGIMLILNDHVFLAFCTSADVHGLCSKDTFPLFHGPAGSLQP